MLCSYSIGKNFLGWHRDCLPVSIKWNRFIFMILFLNTVLFLSSIARLNRICIKNMSKLIPLDNKWALVRKRLHHQLIFVVFLSFALILFHNLKRHKFEKSRTIITMGFSLADNYGLLFPIVNAQHNFAQYFFFQFIKR